MSFDDGVSAIERWRSRVEAHHTQSESVMDEAALSGDFWQRLAPMFRADPRRTDDEALNALLAMVYEDWSVLDVGGGAGRFAVALALKCRSATVVDPSAAMLEQLREAAAEAGADNVSSVHTGWEAARVESADFALCSHVVYGVADIRPFVEKLQDHARRRVALVSFVDSPQSHIAPLWEPVHGERRVNLPALPELMNALWEMDIYPSVTMLSQTRSQRFDSRADALEEMRQRLYVGSDEEKERRLERALGDMLVEVDGGYAMRGARLVRQGVVWWDAK